MSFPIKVSERAVRQLSFWIDKRPIRPYGIRIHLRTRGCSGLSYSLEYVDSPSEKDDQWEEGGVRLLVSPQASLFLVGTEMDYQETALHSGFVFHNPNEKGRCGCGESFRV